MDDTYQRVARALADVEAPGSPRALARASSCGPCARAPFPPAASRPMPAPGNTSPPPPPSTARSPGIIRDSMDDILGKVHEAGLTLKAGCGIGYEFSTLRPRGAYVSRRRRLHLRPAVVHGYLRQDVLHRLLGRWPSRRADGHLRRRPSGCHGIHPRQARERPPAPVQPVAADHRRVHARRCASNRDWQLAFPVREKEFDGDRDSCRHAASSSGASGPRTRATSSTTKAWSPARSTRPCRRAACGTSS